MKVVIKIFVLSLTIGLYSICWARTALCTIQTYDGHYVTAVGGGGRITDVLHTNRTRAGSWELFTLIPLEGETHWGIKTSKGYFLTAVGGGGRITDVIHSDATQWLDWEKFKIIQIQQGVSSYAIKTISGNYLTAVGGGGRTTDVFHTDATRVGTWETFWIKCRLTDSEAREPE